jgi:hypothetical protein
MVLFRMNQPRSRRRIMNTVIMGRSEERPVSALVAVRSFALPTARSVGQRGYSRDWKTPCMTPQQILEVPRVTISAGKRYFPMITPFRIPNTSPISAATIKNGSGLVVTFSIYLHTTNMDRDAIAGKEQSTPPEIRTISSPTQNMTGIVKERIISTRLFPVKNWPLLIWISRQNRTMITPT